MACEVDGENVERELTYSSHIQYHTFTTYLIFETVVFLGEADNDTACLLELTERVAQLQLAPGSRGLWVRRRAE